MLLRFLSIANNCRWSNCLETLRWTTRLCRSLFVSIRLRIFCQWSTSWTSLTRPWVRLVHTLCWSFSLRITTTHYVGWIWLIPNWVSIASISYLMNSSVYLRAAACFNCLFVRNPYLPQGGECSIMDCFNCSVTQGMLASSHSQFFIVNR